MTDEKVVERPTTEGGVWGSYVQYLKDLEAQAESHRELVEENARLREVVEAGRKAQELIDWLLEGTNHKGERAFRHHRSLLNKLPAPDPQQGAPPVSESDPFQNPRNNEIPETSGQQGDS